MTTGTVDKMYEAIAAFVRRSAAPLQERADDADARLADLARRLGEAEAEIRRLRETKL